MNNYSAVLVHSYVKSFIFQYNYESTSDTKDQLFDILYAKHRKIHDNHLIFITLNKLQSMNELFTIIGCKYF